MAAFAFEGGTGSGKSHALATCVRPPGKFGIIDADNQFYIYDGNPNIKGLSEVARVAKDVPEFHLKAGDRAVAVRGVYNFDNWVEGFQRFIEAVREDGGQLIHIDPLTLIWKQTMEVYNSMKYGGQPPERYASLEWRTIKRPYLHILGHVRTNPDMTFGFAVRTKMRYDDQGAPMRGKEDPDIEGQKTYYDVPFIFQAKIRGKDHIVSVAKEKGGYFKIGEEWTNPLGFEIFERMPKLLVPPIPSEDAEEEAAATRNPRVFGGEVITFVTEEQMKAWAERSLKEGPSGAWLKEAKKSEAEGKLRPEQKASLLTLKRQAALAAPSKENN